MSTLFLFYFWLPLYSGCNQFLFLDFWFKPMHVKNIRFNPLHKGKLGNLTQQFWKRKLPKILVNWCGWHFADVPQFQKTPQSSIKTAAIVQQDLPLGKSLFKVWKEGLIFIVPERESKCFNSFHKFIEIKEIKQWRNWRKSSPPTSKVISKHLGLNPTPQ